MMKMLTPDTYDLSAWHLFLDPHPTLRLMRSQDPVHFSGQLGSWVLTRYDDVCAALHDSRLSVVDEAKLIETLPTEDRFGRHRQREILIGRAGRSRPGDHAGFLRLMKRNFAPGKILAQRARIERIVHDRLDAVLQHGMFDAANDVAHPLAMSVMCDLSGIPVDETGMLVRVANDVSALLEMGEPDQWRQWRQGILELADYLRPIIARQRTERPDTLIGAALGPAGARSRYTEEQVVSLAIAFLVAGYHTAANLLCSGLQLLFDHADQRERLVAGQFRLLANALDEMMRIQGPVASVRRIALTDISLRDQVIRAGDTVLLALCAANRDPAVFCDPDRFDIGRPNARRQIGFAVGGYSRIGQSLARLQAHVFFEILLTRFPGLRPLASEPDWMALRPLGRELHTLRVSIN